MVGWIILNMDLETDFYKRSTLTVKYLHLYQGMFNDLYYTLQRTISHKLMNLKSMKPFTRG